MIQEINPIITSNQPNHGPKKFKISGSACLTPNAAHLYNFYTLKFAQGINDPLSFAKSILFQYKGQFFLLAVTSLYKLFFVLSIHNGLLFFKLNFFRDPIMHSGDETTKLVQKILYTATQERRTNPKDYESKEHIKAMFNQVLPLIRSIVLINITPELLIKDMGPILDDSMDPFIEIFDIFKQDIIEKQENNYFQTLINVFFKDEDKEINFLCESKVTDKIQSQLNKIMKSDFLKHLNLKWDLKKPEQWQIMKEEFKKYIIEAIENRSIKKSPFSHQNKIINNILVNDILQALIMKKILHLPGKIGDKPTKQFLFDHLGNAIKSFSLDQGINILYSTASFYAPEIKKWSVLNEFIESSSKEEFSAVFNGTDKQKVKDKLTLEYSNNLADFFDKLKEKKEESVLNEYTKKIIDFPNPNSSQFIKEKQAQLIQNSIDFYSNIHNNFIENLKSQNRQDEGAKFFEDIKEIFKEKNQLSESLTIQMGTFFKDALQSVRDTKKQLSYGLDKDGMINPDNPTEILTHKSYEEIQAMQEHIIKHNPLLNFIFGENYKSILKKEGFFEKFYNGLVNYNSLLQSFLFFNRPDPANNNPVNLQKYVSNWNVFLFNPKIVVNIFVFFCLFVIFYGIHQQVKKYYFTEKIQRQLQEEIKKILLTQEYGYNANKSATELLNSTEIVDKLMKILVYNVVNIPSVLGFVVAISVVSINSILKARADKIDPIKYLRTLPGNQNAKMMPEVELLYNGIQYQAIIFSLVITMSVYFIFVYTYKNIIDSIDLFKISFEAMKDYNIKLNNYMNNLKAIKSYGIEHYKYYQLRQMNKQFVKKLNTAKDYFANKINKNLLITITGCMFAILGLLTIFALYAKNKLKDQLQNVVPEKDKELKVINGLIVALKLDIMLSQLFLLIICWAAVLKVYLSPLHKYVFFYFSCENILEDINLKLKDNTNKIHLVDPTANIKIKNLTYTTKSGDVILKDLNFDIINPVSEGKDGVKGQIVLLLGESGSGKTTMANQIGKMHINPPASVLLENNGKQWVDINEVYDEDLRKYLVYQDQSPMIFDDSLKNNITLGLNFSNQQVFLILKLVRLDVLLTRGFTPRQMEVYESIGIKVDQQLNQKKTVNYTKEERAVWKIIVDKINGQLINGGSNLSGGQRQRIALCRLLIKNATQRIVLMDEATTGLDSENIHIIMKNYLNIFLNPRWNSFPRTLILVTHDIQFILIIIKFAMKNNIPVNFKYLVQGQVAEDVYLKDIKSSTLVLNLLKKELNDQFIDKIQKSYN
jgi:ABC-type multidrug transport system fused ATPase/permease subunit